MQLKQVPVAKFLYEDLSEIAGDLYFMRKSDKSDNVRVANVEVSEPTQLEGRLVQLAQDYCKNNGTPEGIRLRIYDRVDEIMFMGRTEYKQE